MPLVLGGSSIPPVPYDIDNSCKFVRADSAKLSRTQTAGNRTTWTVSFWVKRGLLSLTQRLFSAGDTANPEFLSEFTQTPNEFNTYNTVSSATVGHLTTNRMMRDTTAWYHIVMVWDTDNVTEADRFIAYINGVRQTDMLVDAPPTSSGQVSEVCDTGATMTLGGAHFTSTLHFDGYFSEFVFIDGLALTADSFGEFDSDSPTIWKPKDPTGLTFGTNGFWLDFKDSADLGNDVSGEGNDFTVANLAAADQSLDTPTNNFATINTLCMNASNRPVITDGNCVVYTQTPAPYYMGGFSTYGMSSGLWYAEAIETGDTGLIGIDGVSLSVQIEGNHWTGQGYSSQGYHDNNGIVYTDGADPSPGSPYGDTWADGDIIGMYVDLDANKLYYAINGTIQNSGTGISLIAPNPLVETPKLYFFSCSHFTSAVTFEWNFGNGTFGSTAVSSSNPDANGYGLFEYDPSVGTFDGSSKDFLCLCSKNIGSDGG